MARIKAVKVESCRTREEFEESVNLVAKFSVEIEKLSAALKQRHQALDDKYGEEIKRLEADRAEQMTRAEPYFADHAEELCFKGRREGATKLAKFGVRLGTPKVVKFGKFKKVAWKALGAVFAASDALRKFVRATPEVDKDAILAVWRNAESGDEAVSGPAREAQKVLDAEGFGVEQTDQFWVEALADDQVKNVKD